MQLASPAPRRVARPSWLDLRLVLGVVLVLAAVLLGAKVLASARHTVKAVAVTHDLAVGTTVQPDDLRLVDVSLPASMRSSQVYLSDENKIVGKVVSRPLTAGELVPAHALGSQPGRTTLSIPFATDAAPKLSRGQRIEVWLSAKGCPSVVLLPDVAVQDVHAADEADFAAGSAGQDVVVSVSPQWAQRIVTALAIDGASIRAGVLSGPSTAATAALPPLDDCTAPSTP